KSRTYQLKKFHIRLQIEKMEKVNLEQKLFLDTFRRLENYTDMEKKNNKKKQDHQLNFYQKLQDFSQLEHVDWELIILHPCGLHLV
ncbi:MAG: hypothetical protein SCG72_00480, partial [Nitrosarchaeum sp.]|nr:hypothetical protein [Nitrosarchaeum sp.]